MSRASNRKDHTHAAGFLHFFSANFRGVFMYYVGLWYLGRLVSPALNYALIQSKVVSIFLFVFTID